MLFSVNAFHVVTQNTRLASGLDHQEAAVIGVFHCSGKLELAVALLMAD